MAIALLFNDTIVGTGTGGSTQTVTVPFSGVTGNNCLAVMMCTARVIGTTFNISADFDGNTMTLAAEASAALGGFGEGSASVFYFAAGNLSGASGNAVFTITSSNGLVGRIATLAVYNNVDQITPLVDTDTGSFVSAASNSTLTLTGIASDLCVDSITLGGDASLVAGGTQTELGNTNNGSGNGDPTRHGSSNKIAIAAGESMSWTIGNQSFAHAAARFAEDAAPGGPVITQVTPSGGAGAPVRPSDTNTTVDGTDFDPGGNPTELILSPTTGPSDPSAEIQTISGVTNSTLNWDSVTLGSMQPGPLFLFVRVDPGGPGEDESPPFPVVVSEADIHWDRRTYTTTGATGPTTVVNDLAFKPVAAFIQVTGNTSIDTLQPDCELGQCLVDETTAMGIGIGAQASPSVVKRQQTIGTGALFILDPSSDPAPDVVVGTPTLTSNGMDIDFTTNTSGYLISIGFLGGNTARANLHEIQISDGSVTGLPFAPTALLGVSANMATGSGSDTSFARQSLGVSIGTGTSQFNQSTDLDSNSARNTEILQGTFLAQLNGTSNTWSMVITALTSDGYTWSGSNPDGAFVMAMNTDTAQLFLTQFASTVGGDGASEDLPDSGIDNPGLLFMTTAARTTTGPSGAVGGRWSSGSCYPGEIQGGATNLFLPDSGTGVTEQIVSNTNILQSSSLSGQTTLESQITDFKRAPTIEYIDNPTAGILYNIFMAEEVGVSAGDDEEGAAGANVW